MAAIPQHQVLQGNYDPLPMYSGYVCIGSGLSRSLVTPGFRMRREVPDNGRTCEPPAACVQPGQDREGVR